MTIKSLVVVAAASLMIASGCHREQKDGTITTETIAPATPPTSSTSGTENDTVLTQTVEIGEERSASEGGGLTDSSASTTTASSTTTVATSKPAGAKPKK